MAEIGHLAAALDQVTRLLDELELPYMVIGGVANLAWGRPRTTEDIDITALVPDDRVDEAISALGRHLRVLPEHPDRFWADTHVLPLASSNGTRIDLIRAGLPFEEQAIRRATVKTLGAVQVRVATAEDLVVMKLASERPRDQEDAIEVLRRQGKALDRDYLDPLVRGLVELLDRPEIWGTYEREVSG